MMSLRATSSPEWLAICGHRVSGYRPPFVLILQHPIVQSVTRIVAPVVPALGHKPTILSPRIMIGEDVYRAVLLEMTRTSVGSLGQTVNSARLEDEDTVLAGIDAIFRGYPVGLPLH